jgi:hypothetical protein
MPTDRKTSGVLLKNLMFALLILMLVLPWLQARLGLVKEKPLTGAFSASTAPDFSDFSRSEWLSGTFQETFNTQLENHIGFRNALVRLNNQIDFTAFGQANAEGVIAGKNGELFEEDYLREATGMHYVGDEVWKRKAAQLKAVQDTLAVLGKTLVVLFEPGKATFYPERMPRKYRNIPGKLSNYQQMLKSFDNQQVNVLDLDAYFRQLKGNQWYPLFLKGGTHWSYFGATLAADTALAYLAQKSGMDLPDMKIEGIEQLDTIRHPDNDIGLAMNLIFPLRQEKPAYPIISFSKNDSKPADVLIVGDSFYFNWLNNFILSSAFGNFDFWYYNNNIIHGNGSADGKTADKNFKDEIMKRDIILIMITGRFHHAFAWNFDEQLYNLFFPGYREPETVFANQLRTYDDEFKRMVNEAANMGLSIEQRIKQEASYMFYKDHVNNPEKYQRRDELVKLSRMGISGTPEWMEKIREKAKANGISVEEQLTKDAEWLADEKMKQRGNR